MVIHCADPEETNRLQIGAEVEDEVKKRNSEWKRERASPTSSTTKEGEREPRQKRSKVAPSNKRKFGEYNSSSDEDADAEPADDDLPPHALVLATEGTGVYRMSIQAITEDELQRNFFCCSGKGCDKPAVLYCGKCQHIYCSKECIKKRCHEARCINVNPLVYCHNPLCGNKKMCHFPHVVCTKCYRATYCSRNCQLVHWYAVHKDQHKTKRKANCKLVRAFRSMGLVEPEVYPIVEVDADGYAASDFVVVNANGLEVID